MGAGLLEPFDGRVRSTARQTPLSKLCDEIEGEFIESGARQARVRHEDSGFEFEQLYRGLQRVSRKLAYRRCVRVHKQDGSILLVRRNSRDGF